MRGYSRVAGQIMQCAQQRLRGDSYNQGHSRGRKGTGCQSVYRVHQAEGFRSVRTQFRSGARSSLK